MFLLKKINSLRIRLFLIFKRIGSVCWMVLLEVGLGLLPVLGLFVLELFVVVGISSSFILFSVDENVLFDDEHKVGI